MRNRKRTGVRETREDDRSVTLHLDDNKIAGPIGNRNREQTRFPQGVLVRSGSCGLQAELQGNGDDRAIHRAETTSSSPALAPLLY